MVKDDATDTPGSGLVWFRSAGQKRQFADCGEMMAAELHDSGMNSEFSRVKHVSSLVQTAHGNDSVHALWWRPVSNSSVV